ncbi:hypothetical protein ACEWY4_024937 [Coilia grayii]|uniref:Ig-like domain-containing protein n=1 Tax=Coilia grayii TaxID=363190 RepID=A0ABD1IW46_9TELE
MFVVLLLFWLGPVYSHSEPVQVIAYEGDRVTLPSRRNSTWNLDRIQWSIFSNITFIATLRRGELATDLFWSYTGRLTLNTTTGDLHVNDVKKTDATLYSVLLMDNGSQENHKVKLKVRDRLPVPNVNYTVSPIHEGHCKVNLRCGPRREKLAIRWNSTGPVTFPSLADNSSVLQAELKEHSTANFTCIITDEDRHESSTTQVSCKLKERHRDILAFFAFFLGLFVGLVYGGSRGSQVTEVRQDRVSTE